MAVKLYPWLGDAKAQLDRLAENLPGAIMIHGPRGTGAYELGRYFAERLLCESPVNGEACGHCTGCLLMEKGTHPDFALVLSETEAEIRGLEINTKSSDRKTPSRQISIDQIRQLGEFLGVTSHRGGKKVVLIYPANMMLPDASSSLLKNLEEPPENVVMILVTEDIDSMLPTIRSRCQTVRIRAPRWDDALEYLKAQGVPSAESLLAAVGGMPLLAFEQDAKLKIPDTKQAQLFNVLLNGGNVDKGSLIDVASKELFLPAFVPFMQRFISDLIYAASGLKVRYFRDKEKQITGLAKQVPLKSLYAFFDELAKLSRISSHPLNASLTIQEVLIKYANLFITRTR